MELSRIHFDVLMEAIDNVEFSVSDIHAKTNYSSSVILASINELMSKGLIDKEGITQDGLNALEPYRVKRAIFLAAGLGSRIEPITITVPKPLINVNGDHIIDKAIDACLLVGIDEIYIVRGYLGEQFDQLLNKYPMIKFIDNPDYNISNNISSIFYARDHLNQAYIIDADILIYNPAVIQKYQYNSNFLGRKIKESDDWVFEVENGIIRDERKGGKGDNIWLVVGISYWNNEDATFLKKDVEEAYSTTEGKKQYWEFVPLIEQRDSYSIMIRDCKEDDLVEIDTLEDLKNIDKGYINII